MSNDMKTSKDRRPPPVLETREQSPGKRERALSLDLQPRRHGTELRSSDPYNTSGSFDRTKNWARVGKRGAARPPGAPTPPRGPHWPGASVPWWRLMRNSLFG